ncbi:MAG: hypothetical protein WDW36_005369 [Sanguina aurantia]
MVVDGKIPPEVVRAAADQTLALNPADAVHVFALVKATLDKLSLVGSITVDPKVQAQELTQSVGEEITRMIADQKALEAKFEELVSAQHVLRNLPNKSKLRENQTELQQVAEALRQSTKNLCRNLKDNPNVAENMLKVALERQALQLLLSKCCNDVEMSHKVQPVVESVMAQEAAEVAVRETIEHERATATAVRQLRNDLREEKIDHEGKMRDKKKTLSLLKEEVKALKMQTAVTTRYEAKEGLAINDHNRRVQANGLSELRKELSLVRQQVDIEGAVHATTAEFMKKLSGRLQSESVVWSQRREDDLLNRERDLEHLRVLTQQDTIKLQAMREKHRLELSSKKERQTAVADEMERLEFEVMRQERRSAAAVIMQAAWRGFSVRKMINGDGGKKGGKKAGKKGKK